MSVEWQNQIKYTYVFTEANSFTVLGFMAVIRVKRREIQTLHCSKRFNFSNAYSAQGFI
jgi:hypothetical protein